jgi:hypothetical protein
VQRNPHPTPTVGRIVHYVSYGTPHGEYTSTCRAAMITEVAGPGRPGGVGVPDVALAVFNPTGLFFNPHCSHSDTPTGGTWHWPEQV